MCLDCLFGNGDSEKIVLKLVIIECLLSELNSTALRFEILYYLEIYNLWVSEPATWWSSPPKSFCFFHPVPLWAAGVDYCSLWHNPNSHTTSSIPGLDSLTIALWCTVPPYRLLQTKVSLVLTPLRCFLYSNCHKMSLWTTQQAKTSTPFWD